MDNVAIRTEGLSRDFPSVRAVDDLTITVPAGIIFGFLGQNGAGKTTTIHLLLGLLEPAGGQAHVLGFDVRTQSNAIRQRTGVLLEHAGLYERLSAEDNLELYGRIYRMPAQERATRIKELLSAIGLWERCHDIVGGWSRGMKQKLAVARATLHRPPLIFLAEPIAGLDPLAAAQLRDHLTTLVSKEGMTIFLTTHNLNEAEKVCDQVAVIRHGRVAAAGKPNELLARSSAYQLEIIGDGFNETMLDALRQQPMVDTAFVQQGVLHIHLHSQAETTPLIQLVISHGAAVAEVRKPQESLEDIFLTLARGE